MIEFLQNNSGELAGIAALIIIVGERVAALTETKKDDKIFGILHTVLSKLGLKFPEAK